MGNTNITSLKGLLVKMLEFTKRWRFLSEQVLIKFIILVARSVEWADLPLVAKPTSTLLWRFLPKRRAIAIDNLKKAFKCNEDEAKEMAKKVFTHLVLTALEFLKAGYQTQEAMKKVKLEGIEKVEEAWEQFGRLIFVTGHLGNFELMGSKIAQKFPLWVIARPQSPASWQIIKSIREKLGMKVIDKFGSVREALRVLRRGGALGLLADQHAGEGSGTMVVKFFGRPASVFKTPALLSARTGAPLVFCYDIRLPDGTHSAKFIEPKQVNENEIESVTLWLCEELERAILKAPEQWWWVHDRWKIARR